MLFERETLPLPLLIGLILLFVVCFFLGWYVVSRFQPLTQGAVIDVTHPPDGYSTDAGTLDVSGTVERAVRTHLNGHPFSLTPTGNFSETVTLTPGHNELVFDLVDRFGKHRRTVVTAFRTSDPGMYVPPPDDTQNDQEGDEPEEES